MGVQTTTYMMFGWQVDVDELKEWLESITAGSCSDKKQCMHEDCWNLNTTLKGLNIRITYDDAYNRSDDNAVVSIYFPVDKSIISNPFTIVEFCNENEQLLKDGNKLHTDMTGRTSSPTIFTVINRS